MTDRAPQSSFPAQGDNFVTLGPWRMLQGATWQGFRLAAEAAHGRAATAAGDELSARRAARRAERLRVEGPSPVDAAGPDARA